MVLEEDLKKAEEAIKKNGKCLGCNAIFCLEEYLEKVYSFFEDLMEGAERKGNSYYKKKEFITITLHRYARELLEEIINGKIIVVSEIHLEGEGEGLKQPEKVPTSYVVKIAKTFMEKGTNFYLFDGRPLDPIPTISYVNGELETEY